MENYAYNQSSSYAESGNSSPRSREIDYENPPPPPNYKVKLLCSYGGKIHPRPHDNQLSYVGGETKILSVDRNARLASLLSRLTSLCEYPDAACFKYQLPGEDLDALISVTSDDDLEHMMHEYDRLCRISPNKPARLRLFVFPSLTPSLNSFASDVEAKTEKERFVDALNAPPAPQKASAAVVDDQVVVVSGLDPIIHDPIQKHIHDLQKLRIEEQQVSYGRRRSDDFSGGDYYKLPEKMPPVYVIPSAPSSALYHAPMMRPVNAAPAQGGYYAAVQPQMYGVIPHGAAAALAPPQKVVGGYGDGGYGMVRPETGYAYDSGVGRQVNYSALACWPISSKWRI